MTEAKVYTLTRPVKDSPTWLSNLGDGAKHWALIVEFLDDSGIYLCERSNDNVTTNSILDHISASGSGCDKSVRCAKFKSVEDCKENNAEAEIQYYGDCKTTVEAIEFYTNELGYAKKYHAVANNCQKFVKELIMILNVSLHSGGLPISSDDLITAGTVIIGATAVALLTMESQRKKN